MEANGLNQEWVKCVRLGKDVREELSVLAESGRR
jgi:hypothetical protein